MKYGRNGWIKPSLIQDLSAVWPRTEPLALSDLKGCLTSHQVPALSIWHFDNDSSLFRSFSRLTKDWINVRFWSTLYNGWVLRTPVRQYFVDKRGKWESPHIKIERKLIWLDQCTSRKTHQLMQSFDWVLCFTFRYMPQGLWAPIIKLNGLDTELLRKRSLPLIVWRESKASLWWRQAVSYFNHWRSK